MENKAVVLIEQRNSTGNKDFEILLDEIVGFQLVNRSYSHLLLKHGRVIDINDPIVKPLNELWRMYMTNPESISTKHVYKISQDNQHIEVEAISNEVEISTK